MFPLSNQRGGSKHSQVCRPGSLVLFFINTLTYFKPIWSAAACSAFIARSWLRAHSLGTASCAEPKRKQSCALQIRPRIYGTVYLGQRWTSFLTLLLSETFWECRLIISQWTVLEDGLPRRFDAFEICRILRAARPFIACHFRIGAERSRASDAPLGIHFGLELGGDDLFRKGRQPAGSASLPGE